MINGKLLYEIEKNNLKVYELPMDKNVKGLCIGKNIIINKGLSNEAERNCILAEEIGHYKTTVGDITKGNTVACAKQELKARAYAYDMLIGLDGLVAASEAGSLSSAEAADFLCVTEAFFNDTIKYYIGKYGISTVFDSKEITFIPFLSVKAVKIG